MKNTYIAKRRKVGGFTLLELLVVVGILAIIAGAIITAYDGFQRKAARQTAANIVASMTNTIRTYNVTTEELPNNVETLVSATPGSLQLTAANGSVATSITAPRLNSFLSSDLLEKLTPTPQALSNEQAAALINAGVDTFRFVDLAGDADPTGNDTTVTTALNAIQTVGISDRTVMGSIYSTPRAGEDNSPLGYQVTSSLTTTPGVGGAPDTVSVSGANAFAIWGGRIPTQTTALFENTEVGADPGACLVVLGIGTESTLVNGEADSTAVAGGSVAKLGSAPFYGAVRSNEYNHFMMLVDVNQDPAEFVAVIDSNGNTITDGVAEN